MNSYFGLWVWRSSAISPIRNHSSYVKDGLLATWGIFACILGIFLKLTSVDSIRPNCCFWWYSGVPLRSIRGYACIAVTLKLLQKSTDSLKEFKVWPGSPNIKETSISICFVCVPCKIYLIFDMLLNRCICNCSCLWILCNPILRMTLSASMISSARSTGRFYHFKTTLFLRVANCSNA